MDGIVLPSVDDIAYTLTVAASIVEANGLMTGGLYDAEAVDGGLPRETVRVCAVGAINTAVAGTPVLGLSEDGDLSPQVILADMARAALGQHIGYAVPAWNDVQGRTADEVATALRDTAASLREA
jgi:hypothetical protein